MSLQGGHKLLHKGHQALAARHTVTNAALTGKSATTFAVPAGLRRVINHMDSILAIVARIGYQLVQDALLLRPCRLVVAAANGVHQVSFAFDSSRLTSSDRLWVQVLGQDLS